MPEGTGGGGSSMTKKTPHEELCDQALKHYREISDKATHWNSVVEEAIKFYKKHGGKDE